jgi:integrase
LPSHEYYDDYTDIRDNGNIVLYKRPDHGKPKWYVRIKVPGATGYVKRSCKTTDFADAKRYAEDLYYELEGRIRRGEKLRSPTFQKVFTEWKKELPFLMKDLSPDYIHGNIRVIENYSLDYFGKEPIDRINEPMLLDYYNHRITSSEKEPASTTLRHDRTVLNQIFVYAKKKGYLTEVPNIPAPPVKQNPRPDINGRDWRTLYTYLRKYVKQSQDKRRYRERFYLQQYILILGNTGIRVGEARKLRWTDIDVSITETGEERVTFFVRGKTGVREVICNQGVENYVNRLYEYRSKELEKTPNPKESIFCGKNGKPTYSYKKGFRRVLDECGILYGEDGKVRVPYSLRHTYITMRLTEGVNIYKIAMNTGTSVEMIESFYGKKRVRSPKNVSEITKTSKHRTGSYNNILPWK